MGRPTKSEKRNQQLNLKLTVREMAWLRERALSVGKRPVDFGRTQLFANRPAMPRHTSVHSQLDPLYMAQIARLGNNLNQIARRLNALDHPPPPALEPLLQRIRDIIRKSSTHGSKAL